MTTSMTAKELLDSVKSGETTIKAAVAALEEREAHAVENGKHMRWNSRIALEHLKVCRRKNQVLSFAELAKQEKAKQPAKSSTSKPATKKPAASTRKNGTPQQSNSAELSNAELLELLKSRVADDAKFMSAVMLALHEAM